MRWVIVLGVLVATPAMGQSLQPGQFYMSGSGGTVVLATPSPTITATVPDELHVGSGDDEIVIGHGEITIGHGDDQMLIGHAGNDFYMQHALLVEGEKNLPPPTQPIKENGKMDFIEFLLAFTAAIGIAVGAVVAIGCFFDWVAAAHKKADAVKARLDARDAADTARDEADADAAEFDRVKALLGGDEELTRKVLEG